MRNFDFEEFLASFPFDPVDTNRIGVEREGWIIENDVIVPKAYEVMEYVTHHEIAGITNEFSLCAIEQVYEPVHMNHLLKNLSKQQKILERIGKKLNLEFKFFPVAPEDISKEIYPNSRFLLRAAARTEAQNDATRRIAGIHIHKGLKNHNEALQVYNFCVDHLERIIELAGVEGTERYRLLSVAFKNWLPPKYTSWEHFFQVACKQGFAAELKDCHHLFRLTRHGTLEFRHFNTTDDFNKIVTWAEELNIVFREALNQ